MVAALNPSGGAGGDDGDEKHVRGDGEEGRFRQGDQEKGDKSLRRVGPVDCPVVRATQNSGWGIDGRAEWRASLGYLGTSGLHETVTVLYGP